MPYTSLPSAIKITGLSAMLLLSAYSTHAHAALSAYTSNGADLVYSSVSDVTWTKDANLLGTMISFSADENNNGIKDVIEAIVAASTNNYFGQSYTVTASDFFALGRTNFFGANAFISYLNSISYGDSTSWQLPTIVNFSIGGSNGTSAGNELSELYYQELGGLENKSIPNTNAFDNEQTHAYWAVSGAAPFLGSPYLFYTFDGLGGLHGGAPTNYDLNVWAVTAGQVASVPEPAAAWLLAAGLPLLGAFSSRRKQA